MIKRTLFALKYPSIKNDSEKKNILELIYKFWNYYNEERDSFEFFDDTISTNYKFNILFCGKAFTGKRSCINKILGERKAKKDESLSVSYKIVTYSGQNYPINQSDTLGL